MLFLVNIYIFETTHPVNCCQFFQFKYNFSKLIIYLQKSHWSISVQNKKSPLHASSFASNTHIVRMYDKNWTHTVNETIFNETQIFGILNDISEKSGINRPKRHIQSHSDCSWERKKFLEVYFLNSFQINTKKKYLQW